MTPEHAPAVQAAPAPQQTAAAAPARAEQARALGGLIVEDDASATNPPRMRKREFLDELQDAMCRAVEEGFEGSQYEGRGCPMVGEAIDFYRRLPAQSLEASIRRYAPDTANAGSARDYIPILTGRVRSLLQAFVRTGRVTGIPTELLPMAAMLMLRRTGGLGGLLTAAVGGVLAGIGSAVMGAGRAIGGALRAMFLHRSEPVGPSVDAHAVRAGLGTGARLDGGTQSRMERAFGHDFSSVRIHTDERSGVVAQDLGARALTVGNDVAFAPGEYRPGTPIGDAIIAHELAHTVQQGDATTASAPAYGLEEDADDAAAGALTSLWGGSSVGAPRRRAAVRKRSGLTLQRCKHDEPKAGTKTDGKKDTTPQLVTCKETSLTDEEWRKRSGPARKAHKERSFDEMQTLMTPLMCIALKMHDPSIVLYTAGTSNTSNEVPADYKPYPAVNFDPRLNSKVRHGGNKTLSANAGHSFHVRSDADKGTSYLVLGPGVISSDSPATVQYWYEHERFHVLKHFTPEHVAENDKALEGLKDEKREQKKKVLDANEEMQLYADQFPKWFFRIARLAPDPVKKDGKKTGAFIIVYGGNERFGQFADGYDIADAAPRKNARDAVKKSYLELPKHQSPKEYEGLTGYSLIGKRGEDKRHIFDEWLRSRWRENSDEALTNDLAKELKIDLTVAPEAFK